MSEERAEQIIVISLFVFMASEIGAHLYTKSTGKKDKQHLTRHIVGGFLSFLFASILAVATPELGAVIAIAIATQAFFGQGLPAINKPYEKKESAQEKRERLPGSTPGPFRGIEPLQEASPISLGAEAILI